MEVLHSVLIWLQWCLRALQKYLFLGLNTLVVYGFYRLWRKTGESAHVWLMIGLGVAPFLSALLGVVVGLLPPMPSLKAVTYVFSFANLMLFYVGYGCVFMGLAQLAGDRMPLRDIFSQSAPDSPEELS